MGSYTSNFQRLIAYTKLLTSHVNHGLHHQALSLFHQMHTSLTLDPFVFPPVLKSCVALNRPKLGIAVHAHAVKSSFLSNPFVACALVDMYGKCSSISSARKVFDESPQKNVVVWTAMISLYTHCNCVDDALQLFEVMDVAPDESSFNPIIAALSGLSDGSHKAIGFYRRMRQWGLKPDVITLLALLPACVGVGPLNLIQEIHGYAIRNNIDSHPHLRSGLVEAYGRCGSLVNAHNVFRNMKERDVVVWSCLISAYALHGEAKAALESFQQMQLAKVWPDEITFLGILKACSHAGLTDEALSYFSQMQNDYGLQANSDHYSCLVDVLSRAGRLHEAYEIIQIMPVKVTVTAWGALLAACRTYGELELAEIAGTALSKMEPDNTAIYLLLADMYASAGRHEEAQRMRKEMEERGVKALGGTSWVVYQDS